MSEQYMCVMVPEFPAQARLRLRPELARSAVVVMENALPPAFEKVCSATVAAKRLGIRKGMTRTDLDAFPDITRLSRSAAEESSTRAAALDVLAAFTPRIEVCPAETDFVCVLDMAGTEQLFGNVHKSAESITKSMMSFGLHARMAISSNFHAAVCAAPFATHEPIAIRAGEEASCLANLPTHALPLADTHRQTFALWGIRTLAELAALPETELVVRLGKQGKLLREMARGEHAHLFVPEQSAVRLEDAIEFEYPVEQLESLLFAAGPMLDQLIVRAQAHALSIAALTCTLSLDGGGAHTRELKPALPVSERGVLLKLLHLDLQAHPPPAGVLGLRLHVEPGARGKVQTGLFSPQLPETTRLDVTLAQIEAMVGHGRVGSPRLLDTHQPQNFSVEAFRIPAHVQTEKRASASAVVRQMRPPAVLHVRLDSHQRPSTFTHAGAEYCVTAAYGPWRHSGAWWSPRMWSCEEWDVHAAAGKQSLVCLLVHDLLREQWQLEAMYD